MQPALVELVAGFPGVSNKLDPRTRFIPGSVEPFPLSTARSRAVGFGTKNAVFDENMGQFLFECEGFEGDTSGFLGPSASPVAESGWRRLLVGAGRTSVGDGRCREQMAHYEDPLDDGQRPNVYFHIRTPGMKPYSFWPG